MVNALLELFEIKNKHCVDVEPKRTTTGFNMHSFIEPVNIDRTDNTPLLIKNVCPMIKGTSQKDPQEFLNSILSGLPDEVMSKTFKIGEVPSEVKEGKTNNIMQDNVITINLTNFESDRVDALTSEIYRMVNVYEKSTFSNYIIFYVIPKTFIDRDFKYISLPDKQSNNPVAEDFYNPPNQIFINNSKGTYKLYSIVYKVGPEVSAGHYTNQLFNIGQGNVYMDDDEIIANNNVLATNGPNHSRDPTSESPTIVIYKKDGIDTTESDLTDSSPFPLSNCVVPLANPNDKKANSCFINTVMQSLWYNDELYAALKEYAKANPANPIAKGGNATRRKSNRKKSKRRKSKRTRKI